MKTQTLTIDIANPHFTKVITSRINDKNGLKLTVLLKDGGYPCNLSGYTIKYEAGSNAGTFIRDDCRIIDVSNGVFEYTFSAAAVSANVWVAYFAFEKGEERFTTQDIKIVLSRDVKQGNIKIDNYISDFEKALEAVDGYRKEIDDTNKEIVEVQNKVAELKTLINDKGVQIPKITDDTGGATISVSDSTKNILDEIITKGKGMNTIYCHSSVQGNTPNAKSWRGISYLNSATYGLVIAKDYQNKFFTNYLDNGVWLGWVEHSSFEDVKKLFASWGFDSKKLTLNGKSILEEDVDSLVINKDKQYKKVKVEGDLLINNKLQTLSNAAVWFHKEKNYDSGKWIVEFNDAPRWGFNRTGVERSGGLFHIKESGIYDIHAYLSSLTQTADAEHILEIHLLDSSGKTIEEHEIAGEISGYAGKWVRVTGSFQWYFSAGQKFKIVYNNKDKNQIYTWESRATVTQLSRGLDENNLV